MIPFIGLASDIGGANRGAAEGPLFLKKHLSLNADWKTVLLPPKGAREPLDTIESLNRQLAKKTAALAKTEPFFVSVGGDHSSAIGVWSGVASELRSKGDLGLLWIDAHMDSHTFQTTKSGNIHGMPLAVLLGHGEYCLTQVADPLPKIKPSNIVLLGIRSFEKEEEELLKSLNVKIFYMDEIAKRGIQTVMQEALQIVSRQTAAFGVSFDLDSIDPFFAPAVGTPVPNGIDAYEFLEAIPLFTEFLPIAFEFVEYNPRLDADRKSLCFIQKLMEKIIQISRPILPSQKKSKFGQNNSENRQTFSYARGHV